MKRAWMIVAIAASLALMAAACGGGDAEAPPSPTGGTAGGSNVSVTLEDFSVTADPASVAAGSTTFDVTNNGPSEHEFVVFKTDLAPDALPLEGAVVDETGEGLELIGEIEGIAAGSSESTTFDLQPGAYVLICNVEGHYQSGMHTAFEVTS